MSEDTVARGFLDDEVSIFCVLNRPIEKTVTHFMLCYISVYMCKVVHGI